MLGSPYSQIMLEDPQKEDIYKAIYASLFNYNQLSYSWLQKLAKHWDSVSNNYWLRLNEMDIPYEECILQDYDLFSCQLASHHRRGEFVYLDAIHQNLAHYYHLHR
ncbi:hypothetical protein KFK09_026468 [Dendrobium nobile]|uniref:Uncharacterized protein n=1 Tax=Dendrobium nobile TaxID=94219 RepID=A0A8T3A8B2_DENNO|nr:hypothetical protein KFK09_026468 [Dendrobium nobile]